MSDSTNTNENLSEGSALDPATPLSAGDDVELSIREAYEEIKSRDPGDEQPSEEKEEEESEEVQEQAEPQEVKEGEASTEDDIEPPYNWTAQGKEWFSKLPREAKQEYAKRAKEMDRQFHSVNQEWSKIRNEYQELNQALAPYEKTWASAGLTKTEAVKNLMRAQMMLDNNLIGGLDAIARTYGTSLSGILQQVQQGNVPQQQDPTIQALTQEVQLLKQQLSVGQQQVWEQTATAKLQEMHAVRDEKDEYGRYLRPELHDEQFVTSLAPIYSALEQSFPTASPRELLAKAYTAATGKNPQPRTQQVQHSRNAQRASMSVRTSTPRSIPAESSNGSGPESVEDTLRRTAKTLGLM